MKRPFRQIVRKGNIRLLEKKKHFVLVLAEALMKVGRLGLLPPASRAFLSRFRRRKLRLAGDEKGPVSLSEEVDSLAGTKSVRSGVLCLVHLHKQIEHLLRPSLGLVLEGRPKLQQYVRSAQGVIAHVSGVEVGPSAVVDEHAGVLQKDSQIVDPLLVASLEDAKKRRSLGGRDMGPVEETGNP